MFYSLAKILPVYIGYAFMVVGIESHKRNVSFGIYTPVQQLLWLLVCSLRSKTTGLMSVSAFTKVKNGLEASPLVGWGHNFTSYHNQLFIRSDQIDLQALSIKYWVTCCRHIELQFCLPALLIQVQSDASCQSVVLITWPDWSKTKRQGWFEVFYEMLKRDISFTHIVLDK